MSKYEVKWTSIVGGALLTIAGATEVYINKGYRLRLTKLGWWSSWCNFIAGFLFMLSSSTYGLLSIYSNIIGSAFYLIAALICLYMWKLNLFGLQFMPEINIPN